MGQFLDYIASVFTGNQIESGKHEKPNNHISFTDNSFTQAFSGKGESAKLESVKQSNMKTIYTYHIVGISSFLAHLLMVTVPRVQLENFNIMEPDGWQPIALSLIPLMIHLTTFNAMHEVHKPLNEGAKLSAKNSGLDFDNNDFIHSLKFINLLIAACQVSSIFSNDIIWSVLIIVPAWCYFLTSKFAHFEYKRFAPSPKKQWVKLNISKSPSKSSTPKKQEPVKHDTAQVQATPRTRTKRAVRNIITGVSDKYHAFEQNVANQISQKVFNPLSPKLKMIE